MPADIVRRAINAQYADCEVTCYRVLTLSWELERLERWKVFHAHSLKYLEERNKVSLETLDFWRGWCRDEGVDVQPQEEVMAQNLLEHEYFTLEHLQRHFRDNEKSSASHGVIKPEGQASTKGSSDSEDSNDSNLKISDPELQIPETSDPDVHTNSSDSDPKVSGPELEIPDTDDLEIPNASDPEQTVT